jgi:ribosomal protein L29
MKELKDLKLKDSKELAKLDSGKLQEEIKSASKRMFELQAKLTINELKQTHLVKFLRKYIAQLKTLESAQSSKS